MKKGCLYWLIFGWWLEPIRFLLTSWWRKNSFLLNLFVLVMLLGFWILFGIFFIGIIFVLAIIIVSIKLIQFAAKTIFEMYQTYKTNKYLGKYDKKPQASDFSDQDPSPINSINHNDDQIKMKNTVTICEPDEEHDEHPDITNSLNDVIETPIYADSEQLVDAYCNPIQNAVVIISNKNEKEVIHTPQSASNENFNLCKIDNVNPLFFEVGKAIIEKDKVSIGMIQRIFKIGFNRASRIMNQLETAGIVGAEEGLKPRRILISYEDFINFKDNYKGTFEQHTSIMQEMNSNTPRFMLYNESNKNKKEETTENSISDKQALDYARMCNAYLEHQEEMELYEESK